jgi:hypothetical protein
MCVQALDLVEDAWKTHSNVIKGQALYSMAASQDSWSRSPFSGKQAFADKHRVKASV